MIDKVRSDRIKTALALRYPHGRFGSNNPNWKGGRRLGANGYWEIFKPGYPGSRRNYVFEHRLVMETFLGRRLTPKEHVHHKNNDKLDNRLENLEVLSQADHAREHMTTMRKIKELETRIEFLEALLTKYEIRFS